MSVMDVLEIRSNFNDLPLVRKFLQEFCTNNTSDGFDEDHIAQVELAAYKAISNIIEHVYHGDNGHIIELRVRAEADKVIIELVYHGEAFTPESVPPPSFDGSKSNGFGVYIIANCMDDVQYFKNKKGHNFITMVKEYGK
jgi:anti-sigma regulatory factor (Ser/Thr protein kinase)